MSEAGLLASTRLPAADGGGPRYSCQATRLIHATQTLKWWDPRQYVRDVTTGNRPIRHVLRVLLLAFLRNCYEHTPRGYRLLRWFRARVHRLLTGREVPEFEGVITEHQPTPTGRLDLQPGELVRIKPKAEIVKTLDWRGRNRGMYYDVEMARYCGGTYTVRGRVTRIIDEPTGKMMEMKEPCIMLDGVVCNSEYSEYRLNCPRAIPSYWRELWLERTKPPTEGTS